MESNANQNRPRVMSGVSGDQNPTDNGESAPGGNAKESRRSGALTLPMPSTVESVVRTRTNGPLIAVAAELWIMDDDVVVDATYGLGRFWTEYRPPRLVAHDLDPEKGDGVDFRSLPELDGSVDVLVFDPPYIAQGGRDTSTIPEMLGRFGLVSVPKSVAELELLIQDGIVEAARVLAPSGRLIVKCMDYINGGRLVKGRHHVVTVAERVGLEQVDEFIHASGTGPQPPGRSQLHSRRSHSFLCVFQKRPVWRKSGDRYATLRRSENAALVDVSGRSES